jgi:3-phenylpropionate/trans-cinnamate dioxygenase ferredoxin reductase subunit
MADRHVDHLLVGGGIAAASAAQTLAEQAPGASVLLVGRELDPPYHRPPVSKGYLQGSESREDALIELPDAVEVLTRTSVLALDTAAREAKLSTKQSVSFDTALIATGAMVRRLQVDGANLDGLHYLRALGNADTIRDDVQDATDVVLVGGSYIGCEVAASLTVLGKRCTIVMQEDHPFERGFGPEAGRFFRGVLEQHGVAVIGGVDVSHFAPAADGGERVGQVVLQDGRALHADAVVLGVGAQPDVMLARKAGLQVGETGGIACDRTLRSSAEHVYAAGDCCEYESVIHGERLRVEHETHAEEQGRVAAANMLGAGRDYDVVPYFFSDLADWVSLEYVGPAKAWAQELFEGDVEAGTFWVRYLDEKRRLLAALSVGGAGDLDAARALMVSGEPLA